MEKEFITYQQAIQLLKLGFNEPSLKYCWNDKEYVQWSCKSAMENIYHKQKEFSESKNIFTVSVPTKSQVFRWFREKYNLNHTIELTDNSRSYHYEFMILDSKNREYHDEDCFDQAKRLYNKLEFKNYEDAENECINQLISLIEAKN